MYATVHAFGISVVNLFKSRRRLKAENLLLRHQLNVALRRAPARLRLHGGDRAVVVWLIRLWPSLISGSPYGSARDRASLATGRFQRPLALEVEEEEEGRAAQD
jgi:hypothetical protein